MLYAETGEWTLNIIFSCVLDNGSASNKTAIGKALTDTFYSEAQAILMLPLLMQPIAHPSDLQMDTRGLYSISPHQSALI